MLETLCLPLARLCIRRSWRLQSLVVALKRCLIQAAREELERTGVPVTAAKLSAMSGVHRKDLKQYEAGDLPARLVEHPVVRLISIWRTDRRFCSSSGKPRSLSTDGTESEFMELTRLVGGDVNPYAILFELERIGAIQRHGASIRLVAHAMLDDSHAWKMLAEGIDDLTRAVTFNLEHPQGPKNLQLKTSYDAIPAEHEPELRAWLLTRGTQFHDEIRTYLARFDADVAPRPEGRPKHTIEVSCSAFSVISPSSARHEETKRRRRR